VLFRSPIPDVIKDMNSDVATGTKKILIVDYDEEVIEFISTAIKKFYKNVKIETATNGFMGGKKVAEFKPHLLLLDIKLPDINGYEVLKHLKKENIKIIIVTAYPSKEIKEKILKAGADDFLIKPFSIEELKEKIDVLIGKQLT
jgi:DNA-binding response OmpR family regulator